MQFHFSKQYFLVISIRLLKCQIIDYKSIKDSGIWYFDEKITILAGKNEAGKTAILEALEDFNLNKSIRVEAKPIHNDDLIPTIKIWIILEEKDFTLFPKEITTYLTRKEVEIQIEKRFPNIYKIHNSFFDSFGIKKSDFIYNKQDLINQMSQIIPNFDLSEEYLKNPLDLQKFLKDIKKGKSSKAGKQSQTILLRLSTKAHVSPLPIIDRSFSL